MTYSSGPISVAARNQNLKGGLWVSTILHVIALLFLYFGLPHLMPPLPTHHDLVPINIVEISDMTNTRVKEEKSDQPPAPAPAPAPPPVAAQQQMVQPTPPPEAKPTPPPAVPVPPTPDIAEALKPKPVEKVQPKPVTPPKPKPQPDLMASVLKNVAQLKPVAPPQPQTEVKPDAKPQPAARTAAPSLSDRLTISDEDALRRQIEQCWSPPIGAKDAQNLVVNVTIDVNPDKTVANATIDDQSRYNSDTFFRAAADSAIRAVRNPGCSPLILPDGKYDQWKRIDFTFDPRDM